MTDKRVFFASGNVEKLADVMDVVGSWVDVRVDHYPMLVEELQTIDLRMLVENKLVRAFQQVRQPVIVDHTCLGLRALKGLPGTHSGLFWRTLGDEICAIVERLGDDRAEVTVGLGYTDGQIVQTMVEKQRGTIAAVPRGARQFDWDRIFVPHREVRTYAEMTPAEKNKLSPRARAFDRLGRQLRGRGGK